MCAAALLRCGPRRPGRLPRSGFRRAARGGLTSRRGSGGSLGIRRGRLDRGTTLRIQRRARAARTTVAGATGTAATTTAATATIIGERLTIGAEARRARRQRLAIGTQARAARRQRLAVGTQARAARRQRLAIGTEARAARRQRLAVGAEARATRRERLAVGAEARAARGQRLAIGAKARAARTARSAATRVAIAAGATRATAVVVAARTAAAGTTAVVARIARGGGELPADAGAGHLAALRAIVVLALAVLRAAALVADGLEAAEAARLVAAIAAGAAEAAAAAATTAAAAATATATASAAVIATAAAIALATAALRRAGDAVDRVVVLADRRRAGRALLALEDADEADRLEVGADDIERLDQALRAIGRDRQLAGDALGEGLGFKPLCRLGSAGSGSATEDESRELGQRLHGNEPWRGAGACLTPAAVARRRDCGEKPPRELPGAPRRGAATAEMAAPKTNEAASRGEAARSLAIWPGARTGSTTCRSQPPMVPDADAETSTDTENDAWMLPIIAAAPAI
jgi:hypothetical protein